MKGKRTSRWIEVREIVKKSWGKEIQKELDVILKKARTSAEGDGRKAHEFFLDLGQALLNFSLLVAYPNFNVYQNKMWSLGTYTAYLTEKMEVSGLMDELPGWLGYIFDGCDLGTNTVTSEFKASEKLLEKLPEFVNRHELLMLYLAFLEGYAAFHREIYDYQKKTR